MDDNFKSESRAKHLTSVLFISFPTARVTASSLCSVWLLVTSLIPFIR